MTTIMTTNRNTGTLRWRAPELFPDMQNLDSDEKQPQSTFATDVYAFALVCYEVTIIHIFMQTL
jgi:serine/threonine protein kinase